MKKSSSCPSLTALHNQSHTCVINGIKKIKSHPTFVPHAYNGHNVDVSDIATAAMDITKNDSKYEDIKFITKPQVDLPIPPQSIFQKNVVKNLEYFVVFKAPIHHVGVCMLENSKKNINDVLEGGPKSENNLNLAACLASPCEVAENEGITVDNARKSLYVLTDQNRAGSLLVRIRKSRRNIKLA